MKRERKNYMITEIRILIDSVQKVKGFCEACNKHNGEVEVHSGRYIVDGKSIMGLYSLDLTSPIIAKFEGEISSEVQSAINEFKIEV